MFVASPLFSKTKNSRFNLLLLSDGEYYFTDCSVNLCSAVYSSEAAQLKRIGGRLKVCSKSLFFEPKNFELPIIRYEYRSIKEIGVNKTASGCEDVFYLKVNGAIYMKENNLIQPYVFSREKYYHEFLTKHASVDTLFNEVNQLYKISKQPSIVADSLILETIRKREASISFDITWLDSLYEKPLSEYLATKVTPLVCNAGRLLITNKSICFQPFNSEPVIVEKYSFSSIIQIHKRRYGGVHRALEFFSNSSEYATRNAIQGFFFSFEQKVIRDRVFELLLSQSELKNSKVEDQEQIIQKWQQRIISNFDYLMYINSAACRSFNDLAQYPVFPWIISDYESPTLDFNDVSIYRDLSKPVGALNPERLELFRLRYQETPQDQDAFLYGTHYSTPAYVLYYLLRCLPEHMLKLQNGKFDEPDRLFNSISETWNNVLANPTDLKELIPEFFCVETEGRFLVNEKDINFGIRQNRQQVADVALPPWAKTPTDFICMNKLALESEYVSAHLHEWIDLIFGYKQTGPEAVKANNLFHSLTYVDQIDIEGEEDPARKEIILMQINEFGQVPVRLFDKPHPQRFSSKEHLQANSSHCTEIAKTPQLFSKITGPSPLDAVASKDLPPQPFNYEDVRHSKSKLDYGIITLQEFEQLIKQECISDTSLHSLRPSTVPVIEESLLMRAYSPHNESAVRSPPSHQSTAKDCSRMTTFNCN